MRSLCLLAGLCSSLATAQTLVRVEAHSVLRLPSNSASVLQLDRLEIAEQGTLLIPASLTEIRLGELHLGREARIGIAPSEQPLRLVVARGEIGAGSHISAGGAPGTLQQPAKPGRNLSLRLEKVQTAELTLDARGGAGAPGYRGLDGADGESGGCTWGQATRGHDGQQGGDGQSGAAGGQVRLEVPADFPAQLLQVRLEGGAGGPAGEGGSGGAGGKAKGCWFFRSAGA
ncbi:MAG: collagen-like protein, partial [Pseudomonas sp.]